MINRFHSAVWYKILDLLREDGKLTVITEDEHPDTYPPYFDVQFLTGRVRVTVDWLNK